MHVMSSPSRQKSWQSGRQRVSVLATLAVQKETVSRVLTELREQHKPPGAQKPLSQEKAAARAGVTGRQWQRWESGESEPYLRNLEAVASAFDIPMTRFIGAEEQDDTTSSLESVAELREILRRIESNQRRIMAALNVRAPESDAPPIVPYPEAELPPGADRRAGQGDRREPGTQPRTGSEG